jgi:hypothetical protein
MKLKIEPYDCLCELSAFEVNEIEADYSDLVSKVRSKSDTARIIVAGICNLRELNQPRSTQKV